MSTLVRAVLGSTPYLRCLTSYSTLVNFLYRRCFCALGYLICGFLCFDRFTARAFLSDKDPRLTTAIPQASAPGVSEVSMTDQSGGDKDLSPGGNAL